MEIKEYGETRLQETMPTKLQAAEMVVKEGKNVLESVNTLNMSEEEKEQSSSPDVASFLNPKQQRIWNHLSENKKKRYLKTQERKAAVLNTEQSMAQNTGERAAALRVREENTIIVNAGSGAGKQAVKREAVKGTAVGVGNAATGGVLLAADAAKKTADKFKEALIRKSAEQMEYIKQLQKDQKAGKSRQKESKGMDGAGPFLSATVGMFAGLLFLLLILLSVLVIVMGSLAGESSTGGKRIVEVAKAELAVSEYNVGGTKYKQWYGLDGDWCAMFVSWCGNECGYIEDGTMIKSASVKVSKNWYEERNLYRTKESEYLPKEGDLVFFLNGMSHVGIVVSYDVATDQITVIEGNSGASSATPYHAGSRVTQNVYQRTAGSISGYGTPVYPEEDMNAEEEESVEENRNAGGEAA